MGGMGRVGIMRRMLGSFSLNYGSRPCAISLVLSGKHIMHFRDMLKRINRSGGSIASLFVLFGVIAHTHWLARFRMEMADRQFALMDDRTLYEMKTIDFIHGHLWLVAAYFTVFLCCLLWLELRTAPRWVVCVTFIVWALPSLTYARACFHIGNKFIMWSA